MALSYSLDLVTPLSAAEVAQNLDEVTRSLQLFDTSATVDALLGDGAVTVRGTLLTVNPLKPIPWGDPLIGSRVFTPTVSVDFRLDKGADIPGQQDDMTRIATALLARVPGDAALHFESDDVWLLRQDGELSLSESPDLWPPDRLAAIASPYRRQTFQFSEQDQD